MGEGPEFPKGLQQRQIRCRDQHISGVTAGSPLLVCRIRDRGGQLVGRQSVREPVGVATVRCQIATVDVPETGRRVENGEQVDRVQRKVGDTVVLEGDVDGRHGGVGRSRLAERGVKDRDGAEGRQPFEQSTVGPVGISDQDEVDVGLILRGQLAQLRLRDAGHRGALRVAEHHDRTLRTRVVRSDQIAGQLGHTAGHRLIQFGAGQPTPALPWERPELGDVGHRFRRAHTRARLGCRADVVADGVLHVARHGRRVGHRRAGNDQRGRGEGDRGGHSGGECCGSRPQHGKNREHRTSHDAHG